MKRVEALTKEVSVMMSQYLFGFVQKNYNFLSLYDLRLAASEA